MFFQCKILPRLWVYLFGSAGAHTYPKSGQVNQVSRKKFFAYESLQSFGFNLGQVFMGHLVSIFVTVLVLNYCEAITFWH